MARRTSASAPPSSPSPADRLGEAIRELAVTQAELARRAHVSPAYVNDVLRGRRPLTEAFARHLQLDFGIDQIWLRHGEGHMFHRLSFQAGQKGSIALVHVPLLERPCRGNPLDSDQWLGSTHPLPRGLARPSAPDRYRYVLRVHTCPAKGEIRVGDLVLVENLPRADENELNNCWCTALIRDEVTVLQIKIPHRLVGLQIWGRCVGVVWHALATAD